MEIKFFQIVTKSVYPKLLLPLLLISGEMVLAQKQFPVANNDNYDARLNQNLSVDAVDGLTSNDTDPNGGVLTVNPIPLSGPSKGSVTINQDGSFMYVPQNGFVGTDAFDYQVCDNGQPNILVSQFDFGTAMLTAATVGPNATSINPDALHTGCGIFIPSSASGGSAGLDVVVPNTSNIFNFTSFRIAFDYMDQEATAEIVRGGNFKLYHISGNSLGIQIKVKNAITGTTGTYTATLGNFVAGNVPYVVEYDQITGDVIYTANGTTTTISNVAPDFSPLNTALASSINIGTAMDNSGSANPSLCSIAITDTSNWCSSGQVEITIGASLITNRKITYRVKKN